MMAVKVEALGGGKGCMGLGHVADDDVDHLSDQVRRVEEGREGGLEEDQPGQVQRGVDRQHLGPPQGLQEQGKVRRRGLVCKGQ